MSSWSRLALLVALAALAHLVHTPLPSGLAAMRGDLHAIVLAGVSGIEGIGARWRDESVGGGVACVAETPREARETLPDGVAW